MRKLQLAIAAGLLFSVTISAVQGGVLIKVPFAAKGRVTHATAINDHNVITGYWFDKKGHERGFFGTLDGQYTDFDYTGKGVTGTNPERINNGGAITGFALASGPCFDDGPVFYRKADGTMITITKNGQPIMGDLSGLTANGIAVGAMDNSGCTRSAFKATNGKFDKTLPLNPVTRLTPTGINQDGTIVGIYFDSDELTDHGFRYQNGVMMQVDYPGKNVSNTHLLDVNDKGIAIGDYQDDQGDAHAFELDLNTNTFTPFKPTGEANVEPSGINNAGFVTLILQEGGGSYVYCPLAASKCPGKGVHMSMGTPVRAAPGSVLHYPMPRLTTGFGSAPRP